MGALDDTRVVITRAAHQARNLQHLFEDEGARVELLPLLEILEPIDTRPLERAATELALFEWVVFTSANAVEALVEAAGGCLPERLRVAAVGAATARALRSFDIEVELVPQVGRAEGLVAELGPRVARRQRVLLPQAADARPTLDEGLRAAGAEVVRIHAYRKRVPPETPQRVERLFGAEGGWGWVTFTSPSTVRHLADALSARWSEAPGRLLAASIGPVTTEALKARGIEPAAIAASPTDASLVAAVVAAANNAKRSLDLSSERTRARTN